MDSPETDFGELNDIIAEPVSSPYSYCLLPNPSHLNRRQSGQRPVGEAVGSGSLDQLLLREKTEKLAGYCFSEGCHLQLGNYHFIKDGEAQAVVEAAVRKNPLDCRIDFYFQEGKRGSLLKTSLFIEEFSRYLGMDLGFGHHDLIRLACRNMPDILSEEHEFRFFCFESRKGQYSFTLRKMPFTFDLSCREYLDQDKFKFNLAKSSPDLSWLVFERYPSINKIRIEGVIPCRITGPDGIVDDIGQNPSLLENYLDFGERGILA